MAIKKEDSLTNWISTFGTKKFILAADVKNEQIVVRGWTETSTLTVFEFIEKYSAKGINQFFCTDVNKDGALQGPATDLYRKITDKCPSIHLIASGGVSNLKDLEDLKDAGCTGVIIGKAIYENRIKLSDLINLK